MCAHSGNGNPSIPQLHYSTSLYFQELILIVYYFEVLYWILMIQLDPMTPTLLASNRQAWSKTSSISAVIIWNRKLTTSIWVRPHLPKLRFYQFIVHLLCGPCDNYLMSFELIWIINGIIDYVPRWSHIMKKFLRLRKVATPAPLIPLCIKYSSGYC